VSPQGFVLTSFAMRECLDAAAAEIARDTAPADARLEARRRLRGHVPRRRRRPDLPLGRLAARSLKLDDFGKVTLITGASEIGQGSETVLP